MTKKDIQILFDIKFSALSEKKERAKKSLVHNIIDWVNDKQ